MEKGTIASFRACGICERCVFRAPTLFGRDLRQIRGRTLVAAIADELDANAVHADRPVHEVATVLKVLCVDDAPDVD